ncbi:lactonase family protein [Phreatobacter oligotrophus]|nr:beta-propeller fold lactonase family protein [Phreatobacter oligotrophus]
MTALAAVFGAHAPPAVAATYVYVSNAESREISVLRLDREARVLRPVQTVQVTGTAMPMAISPDKRFLYVALRSQPFSVAAFGINPSTGELSPIATSPLPDSMAYVATDRTGRFLLSASYGGDKLAVNAIAANGTVAAEPLQVVATRRHAHALLTDRSNRRAFATNLGGDVVLQFNFDAATGQLAPNAPPAIETDKGQGPRHLVFHPGDRFAYLLNELDATVNVYPYDAATGLMGARIQRASALPDGFQGGAPWAAEIRITADGRRLYASERRSSTLSVFAVDEGTGQLRRTAVVPTEEQPRGFSLDAAGQFLVAVGQKSHAATLYAIDPATGHLSAVHRLPLGKDPNWVEIVDLP